MTTNQTSAPGNRIWGAGRHSTWRKTAVVLAVLATIGFLAYARLETTESQSNRAVDLQMPVANPPIDPDRPDLIGEPKIDEQ